MTSFLANYMINIVFKKTADLKKRQKHRNKRKNFNQLCAANVSAVRAVSFHQKGEHITDIYITESGATELENLSPNIIDIFIIET